MTDALIARLEAATEGSRDLDCEIYCAANPRCELAYGAPGVRIRGNQTVFQPPRFSTSIDAALSLVPDGSGWTVGACTNNTRYAEVFSAGGTKYVVCRAATPALALCIAALRARAAGEETK